MKTVTVEASKKYDVIIAPDILDKSGEYILSACGGTAAAIVTDDTVDALYGEIVKNSLESAGYRTFKFVFKSGEKSKNAQSYISLINFLADSKLTRADTVVALGGGVPGDLAGFAAATFMRGISFAQLPTTLLAAVDSSVGGKTGIDLDAGKNLAGAFYQPSLVLCDYSTLNTLSSEVFSDGLAEVIKYGMIADKELFKMLNNPVRPQLEEIIARCVSIKRDIVNTDEHETGLRKLLNFGHTFGHAIESLSNYQISHGSAVAIGMLIITRAYVKLGICPKDALDALTGLIAQNKLPTKTGLSADNILNAAMSDKKRSGSSVDLIVPLAVGQCEIRTANINELKEIITLGLEGQDD